MKTLMYYMIGLCYILYVVLDENHYILSCRAMLYVQCYMLYQDGYILGVCYILY